MKISFNPQITNSQNYTSKFEKNIEKKQNINITQLPKNSISEAIGRSQVVSFGASNKRTKDDFDHICSVLLGNKEHINFDKKTGTYTHQIFSRKGGLKEEELYIHPERTEKITKVAADGSKTITTRTPETVIFEKFNTNGDKIYHRQTDKKGNIAVVKHDYEHGIIESHQTLNGNKETHVFDLETKEELFRGPKVMRVKFVPAEKGSNYAGTYVTRNIVTDQVVKEEVVDKNHNMASLDVFSEDTGLIIKSVEYNYDTNRYEEYRYSGEGDNNKTAFISTSRDKSLKHVILYEEDGVSEKSNIEYHYKGKQLDTKFIYTNNTSDIEKAVKYHGNSYAEYYYSPETGKPTHAQIYRNEVLVKELEYFNNGKTVSAQRTYNDDGTYTEAFFTRRGKIYQQNTYNNEDKLLKTETMDTQGGFTTKVQEFDLETNNMTETFFNNNGKNVARVVVSDMYGKTKEIRNYYTDGKTVQSERIYHPDGSRTDTFYTPLGEKLRTEEHPTIRQQPENKTYRRRAEKAKAEKDNAAISDEIFIDRINNTLSKSEGAKLTSSELKRLAGILGVETIGSLLNMDKQQYLSLMRKFNISSGNASKMTENIFNIINKLYNRE